MKNKSLLLLCGFFFHLVADHKPIVVVIPSFNNQEWCIQNIDSVLDQDYDNFRIIFIDDHSTDATLRLVKERVAERAQEDRVTFIENSVNRKQLANHYVAVHMCANHEIIVHVDGDDFFAHNQVLSKVNEVYQNPQVWMTYGQFQEWPSGEKGRCEQLSDVVIRNNMFRHAPWVTSHLRTFYAGLFKRIKLADLLYDGTFFPCSADFAMMYPMLEMAGDRSAFISDVMYLYNRQNPISYFRIAQGTTAHLEIHIRGKKKYEKLPAIDIIQPQREHMQAADVVIFSDDSPQQLYFFVRALLDNVSGLRSATVLYQASSEYIEKAYQGLLSKMQGVHAVRYAKGPEFKKELFKIMHERVGEYVLLAHDNSIAIRKCDMRACISKLESTYAYAFHTDLGVDSDHKEPLCRSQKVPPMVYVGDDMYAWQYIYGEYDWHKAHTLHATLYRSQDVIIDMSDMVFNCPAEFERVWHDAYLDAQALGLSYAQTKVLVDCGGSC